MVRHCLKTEVAAVVGAGGKVADVFSPITESKVPLTPPGVSNPRFLPSADVTSKLEVLLTGLFAVFGREARAVSWFGCVATAANALRKFE
jgi:hypothetical protein